MERPMSGSEDIIEIFDSDDEVEVLREVPTYSQNRPPLFLPDAEELPSSGPSRNDEDMEIDLDNLMSSQTNPHLDNSLDEHLARIVEIIPDVDPDYVRSQLTAQYAVEKGNAMEVVLHSLFENSDYPKLEKQKGKRKREASDDSLEAVDHKKRATEVQVDYGNKDRKWNGGTYYSKLALDQLCADFPTIPRGHVRKTLEQENRFYAPTYLRLDRERKQDHLPYKPIMNSRSKKGKGKGKAVERYDEELEKEKKWILQKIHEDISVRDEQVAEKLNEQQYDEAGAGIECGCCFADYPFEEMIQCPEAHLFCITCMSKYAETQLGSHDWNLICMDQSGCKLPFPESELRRFLNPKLLALYERVKQRKEIEAAGLENLEECPFCEYKYVIENEQEKLFRCENAECGAVTCRACKKLDHLPKSCKEVVDDNKLDAIHAVEEAMTKALMRNCPKCQKAFVKESGCNKMTCPNCRTLSCYVCRQIVTGYDHFHQNSLHAQSVMKSKKCPLWDSVEQRHVDEVTEAQKRAIEEYKREHPEVEEKDLKIDLPTAGPSNAQTVVRGRNPHLMIPNPFPVALPAFGNGNRLFQQNPVPGILPQAHVVYHGFGPMMNLPQVQVQVDGRDAQIHFHHHHPNPVPFVLPPPPIPQAPAQQMAGRYALRNRQVERREDEEPPAIRGRAGAGVALPRPPEFGARMQQAMADFGRAQADYVRIRDMHQAALAAAQMNHPYAYVPNAAPVPVRTPPPPRRNTRARVRAADAANAPKKRRR